MEKVNLKKWTVSMKGKDDAQDPTDVTKEFKLEAVQLAQSSHKSMAQIARELGIAESTLHRWCQQYGEHGEQAFPGSGHQLPHEEEIRRLQRENELLRQERDILKKALGIFSRGQL
jgi:transposase